MLQLTTETNINVMCDISLDDNTGFYHDIDNPNGFIAAAYQRPGDNYYKLSDGYFLNVLVLKNTDGTNLVINPDTKPYRVSGVDENQSVIEQDLSFNSEKDGLLYVYRFFIISKNFYDATIDFNPTFFEDRVIVYYDESTDTYSKYDDILESFVEISLFELIDLMPLDISGAYTYTEIMSICNINKIYFNIESQLINYNYFECPEKLNKQLIFARDYLFMFKGIYDYLGELDNQKEQRRKIEAFNTCCQTFKNLLSDVDSYCGCY